MTPGARWNGGPTGVGFGVSTSLFVEPTGKEPTVGADKRPSSNSLIWKQSGRETLWDIYFFLHENLIRHILFTLDSMAFILPFMSAMLVQFRHSA